jgi:hypothetical protein
MCNFEHIQRFFLILIIIFLRFIILTASRLDSNPGPALRQAGANTNKLATPYPVLHFFDTLTLTNEYFVTATAFGFIAIFFFLHLIPILEKPGLWHANVCILGRICIL